MASSCIPYAGGVPAAPGPPHWWDASGGTTAEFNTRIDDPRWRGSLAKTYLPSGSGTATQHLIFRALYDAPAEGQSYLYLSWWVQTDPTLTPGTLGDRIFVGFGLSDGSAVVIRMPAFNSTATVEAGTSPGATFWEQAAGATSWSQVGNTPNWIPTYERSWVDSASHMWAVNLRVPLFTGGGGGAWDDTGISLGSPFKMWYEARVDAGAGVVPFKWPRTVTNTSGLATFPAVTDWGDWQLGGSVGDPNCLPGVSLEVADVGTTNVDTNGNPAPNLIKWDDVNVVENTFFAKPLNGMATDIPAGNIAARFRLANWGSNADWNDVTNPDLLWSDIPGGSNVTQAGPISSGAKGNLTFNWRLTAAEITPFKSGDKRSHQCMLVELSGGGLDFANSSVYRNMDVVKASTFERAAEINVLGLGSAGGSHRDVYLYIQRLNMPRDVPSGEQSPPPAIPGEGESEVLTHIRKQPSLWEVAQRVPTVLVHVYVDSGEQLEDEDGQMRPIFLPMTSFGHFVTHDGPLYGWDADLGGVQLEEIAPDFYKVKIPNDDKVDVTLNVKAHEEPRPPEEQDDGGGCLGWLLKVLPKGLARLLRRLLGQGN